MYVEFNQAYLSVIRYWTEPSELGTLGVATFCNLSSIAFGEVGIIKKPLKSPWNGPASLAGSLAIAAACAAATLQGWLAAKFIV